jgi:hypothetical protein
MPWPANSGSLNSRLASSNRCSMTYSVAPSRLGKRGDRERREREAGCGGRGCADRRAARMRTAKSWGPGAPRSGAKFVMVRFAHYTGDGSKRDGSPGRARISRKPSRREKAGCHRLYLWFSRSRKLSLRGSPGCMRPPGLPCALFISRRAKPKQNSGETRRENVGAWLRFLRGPSFETRPVGRSSG